MGMNVLIGIKPADWAVFIPVNAKRIRVNQTLTGVQPDNLTDCQIARFSKLQHRHAATFERHGRINDIVHIDFF